MRKRGDSSVTAFWSLSTWSTYNGEDSTCMIFTVSKVGTASFLYAKRNRAKSWYMGIDLQNASNVLERWMILALILSITVAKRRRRPKKCISSIWAHTTCRWPSTNK